MKKFVIILFIILGILTMFSGCGNNEKNENTSNKEKKLVQEVLDIPEEIVSLSDVIEGKNGDILAIERGEENQSVWSYNINEKEWREEYNITELLKNAGASVEKGELLTYISPEKELFCILNEWNVETEELINSEYYYVKEQSVESIHIDSDEAIYQAVFTDTDSIVLQDVVGNFYKYSKEKKKIVNTYLKSEEKGYADTFYVLDNCLYIIISDEIYIFDTTTGNSLEKEPEDEFFIENYCITSDIEESLLTKIVKNDNEIFCFNKEGISKYSKSEKECLIEATDTCASYQGAILEDFFYGKNEMFWANFYTMEGTKLCCYSYKDVNEIDKKESITLYTLYETNEWNQLIAFYKEKYPEVTIKVETGISSDSIVTESEAIKKLNTELLNGEGPDIICFDGFGAENYEDYLEDLSDFVQEQEEICYENIIKAYKNDRGIYQIPMRFSCVGVIGKETDLEEFANIEKLFSVTNLDSQRINEAYFTNIFALLCRTYVGQQNNFTEEMTQTSLEEFYNCMEQIHKQCGDNVLENAMFSLEEIGIRNVDYNEIFPINLENNDLSFCYITNGQSWQRLKTAEKDYGVEYRNFNDTDNRYFATQNVLGVNKNSKNKDQSMNFIEFALSQRGQQAFTSFSLSVNQSVLYEDFLNSNVEAWYYNDESGNEVEWKMGELTEEHITQFEEMIKEFNKPISNHQLLVDMIQQPYVEYLEGEISLEEALRQATGKIELHQMEN